MINDLANHHGGALHDVMESLDAAWTRYLAFLMVPMARPVDVTALPLRPQALSAIGDAISAVAEVAGACGMPTDRATAIQATSVIVGAA